MGFSFRGSHWRVLFSWVEKNNSHNKMWMKRYVGMIGKILLKWLYISESLELFLFATQSISPVRALLVLAIYVVHDYTY